MTTGDDELGLELSDDTTCGNKEEAAAAGEVDNAKRRSRRMVDDVAVECEEKGREICLRARTPTGTLGSE